MDTVKNFFFTVSLHFFYIAIITLFGINNIHAQNFVPNSSFEDTITCPQNMGASCPNTNQGSFDAIYYWTNPICTSPDIFHQCNTDGIISIPNNSLGHQYARTGNAMAGLYSGCTNTLHGTFYCEYITSPLTGNLIADQIYTISFYVVCATPPLAGCNGTNGIGAFLSAGLPDTTGSTYNRRMYANAQVNNPVNNIISDTANWVLISDTLTAVGGENQITIGNFLHDTVLTGGAYFYIDDVKVEPGNHLGIIHNSSTKSFTIFPNPADNILNTRCTEKIERIEIFNSIGSLIKIQSFNSTEIDISLLPNGIYYLAAYIGNNVITHKFIKQ